MVAATGIAPDGDEAACRWAAVRHADDHIHIIATLVVRDDGRRPRLHNKARRAQTEARRIEADYGPRRVAPGDGTDMPSDQATGPKPSGPATARRRAAAAAWQAVLVIDSGEDGQVAAHIAAAGEVLDALAKTSAAHTRTELREAAAVFERATRSHVVAEHGHDRALRQAARDLVHSGPHAKKEHAQQAAAARKAAEHLRTAYRVLPKCP